MKKIVALLLALGVAVGLAACSGASPSDQVDKELQEIKNEELADDIGDIFDDEEMSKKYAEDFQGWFEKLQDFDYVIKDEKVDGDKATVTVEITTYDFGAAFEETYNQMIADATAGTITADTDLEDYTYKLLFEKLNGVTDKTYTKEIVVNCTKDDDGAWETDLESNSDALDAIFGGMMTKIAALGG
jgi:ABC-type glycerol-3-phosphate transport system substrate-binding protein